MVGYLLAPQLRGEDVGDLQRINVLHLSGANSTTFIIRRLLYCVALFATRHLRAVRVC